MKDKKDSNKICGVLSLETSLNVEVMGRLTPMELIWSEGQIGAMPAYQNYEDALNYVDGDEQRVFVLQFK